MDSIPHTKSPASKPHDTRLKELFRNKGAFISFLKDCVKPEWIEDLDEDSLKRSEDSFILQDFRQKEADIVYEATISGGRQKVIFYVLLELQSRVDYRMPYRLLLYMVEILRDYYNNADEKARLKKSFKFPAVIPIVFYSGKRRWSVPANLREMFDGHKRFGNSLIDFRYSLVDASGYNDESVRDFGSKLLKVAMLLGKSGSITEIIDITEKYKNDIIQLDEEEQRILRAAVSILSSLYSSNKSDKDNEEITITNGERAGGMFETFIANEKKRMRELKKESFRQGVEQGVEKGIEQGIEKGVTLNCIETAKRLLNLGMSAELISAATLLTIEEVNDLKKGLSIVSEEPPPYQQI